MNNQEDEKTKKEFTDYNDYHDRGFLKWATAFAMPELTKSIDTNHKNAIKNVEVLPQMSTQAIDEILTEAFIKHSPVSVQLNLKDDFNRLLDPIEGYFIGQAYDNELVIGSESIKWEEIRNIKIIQVIKWSSFEVFKKSEVDEQNPFLYENQEVREYD